MQEKSRRIYAIDIFRALTMLLMIFVNDLWTLKDIPGWLEHTQADEDGMGLADVVFPCFLFIAGMSIPYAIQSRVNFGETKLKIAGHILLRSLALIVMGFYIVNLDTLNEAASGISKEWYQVLMFIAFLMIWNKYPEENSRLKLLFTGLKLAGILILIFLYRKFAGNEEDGILGGMRPQWWGILGLIGWAYLGCAMLCLFLYRNLLGLFILWIFFLVMNILMQAGWIIIDVQFITNSLFPGDGAFHAFTAAGMYAGVLLERTVKNKRFSTLALYFFLAGILSIGAGLFLNGAFIISKIRATPPWVTICTGIAFLVFIPVYYITDIKEKQKWFSIIKIAGTATLTCYLLPYLFYSVDGLTGISIPEFLKTGIVGIIKSAFFSFLIIWLTRLLVKTGIKIRI